MTILKVTCYRQKIDLKSSLKLSKQDESTQNMPYSIFLSHHKIHSGDLFSDKTASVENFCVFYFH